MDLLVLALSGQTRRVRASRAELSQLHLMTTLHLPIYLSSSERSSQPLPRESGGAFALGAIPPPGLVLLAIVAIQVGAGLATHLFPVLGAEGTVAARIVFSALLLGIATRGRIHTLGQVFLRNWGLLIAFGLCVAIMNLFFYQAIARIPLGAVLLDERIGTQGMIAVTCVVTAAIGMTLTEKRER